MQVVYIDRKYSQISVNKTSLVLHIADKRPQSLPLILINQIIVLADIAIKSRVISRLAGLGISVSIINLYKPEQRSILLPIDSKNPYLRLLQYQAFECVPVKQKFAKQWVYAKVVNQRRFIAYAKQQRSDLSYALGKAQHTLMTIEKNIHNNAPNVASLRGLEGNAASVYFSAYQRLFANSLDFTGRKKRPPPDPVNALLSLSYTLLHNRCTGLIHAHGLDAMIGFLHEPLYSRASLAADMIEPWRPYIDRWVWRLFRDRVFRAEDFSLKNNACFLAKAARPRFFAAFEQQHAALFRAMRMQCRHFTETLKLSDHDRQILHFPLE